MMNTLFAATLAALMTAPAVAAGFWDTDPMHSLKRELAEKPSVAAVPASAPVATAAATPERIFAESIDDNTAAGKGSVDLLRFKLSDDGDSYGNKVGAELGVCSTTFGGGDGDDDCTSMTFYFPQLQYDRATQMITLNGDPVERLGTFFWQQWKSPKYKLGYTTQSKVWTNGFDSRVHSAYAVYLEKVAQ